MLGCGTTKVYELLNEGRLQAAEKFGRRRMVLKSSVVALLQAGGIAAQPAPPTKSAAAKPRVPHSAAQVTKLSRSSPMRSSSKPMDFAARFTTCRIHQSAGAAPRDWSRKAAPKTCASTDCTWTRPDLWTNVIVPAMAPCPYSTFTLPPPRAKRSSSVQCMPDLTWSISTSLGRGEHPSSSRSQEKNNLMAAMRWRLATTFFFASSYQPLRSCFSSWSRRPRRSFSKSASAHCAR